MKWDPDYRSIKIKRFQLDEYLSKDPIAAAVAMNYYRTHPIEWIEDWCVTFDPRLVENRLMPFILFQRQKEFVQFLLECLEDRESGLIEKARDIGASWICCAFSVWLWLFHPGVAIGWGSRKEEYVDDKGNPKAIFPKMRQIIGRLPAWMQPKDFNMNIHATYMKIANPENGSFIMGEAGDNIGRGGRTTIFFKDESAHYERPEQIEAALGDNTDVQIDISSVNGVGNVFHKRRMAGQIWYPFGDRIAKGRTRVFIFEWRDHPNKTQAWYDNRRQKAEAEGLLHIFAQEVDRNYSAATFGIIIPQEWVEASVDAHIRLGIPDEGEKTAGQDIADGGGDKNALAMRYGITLRYCDHWSGEAGDAARIAIPLANKFGCNELYYDSVAVGVGFRVETNTMIKEPQWNKRLRVKPWNGAGEVLQPDQPTIRGDRMSPLNKDQWENLKAQSWFRLRSRFWKTYCAVNRGSAFKPDDLISLDSRIPRLHELKAELSQAIKKTSKRGKTMVDKNPAGTASPNLADSVVICYNPTRKVSGFDIV